MSAVVWMIWRCRFDRSTTSKSTMPMRADARGGEIERHRRAEAAGADAQDARRLQLALPLEADLGEDQVPAVALVFLRRQRRQLPLGDRRARRAARHRRDDAERVARLQGGVFLLQVADVLVVQVDVDEAPQLAFVVVEVLAQVAVGRDQVRQRFAHRPARDFDAFLLVDVGPERRGNVDRRHKISTLPQPLQGVPDRLVIPGAKAVSSVRPGDRRGPPCRPRSVRGRARGRQPRPGRASRARWWRG